MATSIGAASAYVAKLDEEYKAASLTSILDVDPDWVTETDVAGTFYLPKISLVGLGDYSKTDGYPDGDVTFEWTAYSYTEDRGRGFLVDKVDDMNAAGRAFAKLASTFLTQEVVPEVDAYRMAKIATDHGTDATGTLSTVDGIADALNTGMDAMDENEVPESRVLFITPTLARLYSTMAKASTDNQTDAFDRCTVVRIPSARFYTTCTLNAGATGSAGGYTNAGKAINFMIVDKGAVFADARHNPIRIFSPNGEGGYAEYQSKNAWHYDYRLVHDAWMYSNRTTKGAYVHTK